MTQIDKVDILYYTKTDRIDISEETRIRATLDEAKQFREMHAASCRFSSFSIVGNVTDNRNSAVAPNFISEIFFLLYGFVHIGLQRVMTVHGYRERNLQHTESELRSLEQDQTWVGVRCLLSLYGNKSQMASQTPREAMHRTQLERMKAELQKQQARISATEVQLLDPQFIATQSAFFNFAMAWLVRAVDPHGKHPAVPIELPLPEKAPVEFSMLPEYLIDDTVGFFHFVSR